MNNVLRPSNRGTVPEVGVSTGILGRASSLQDLEWLQEHTRVDVQLATLAGEAASHEMARNDTPLLLSMPSQRQPEFNENSRSSGLTRDPPPSVHETVDEVG